jgi:hypothetical protein
LLGVTLGVKPGDKLEGPVPFTVCATINDLSKDVLIPSFIVDDVSKAAGLTPVWPLGVFVIFTEEGATVCVYGHDEHGNYDTKRNTIELKDDVIPPIGEAVWTMWKELRNTSEDDLVIGLSILKSLTGQC